jgi:NNP family nitrate/nitrite transporter-like MFS transporter
MKRTSWIDTWTPEDPAFWAATGKPIARRNMIWSILAEHIGFSVWMIWSVISTQLGKVGFHFTPDQLLWLVALPGLVGALIRFPYTFAVPKLGGRNWTIISALLLAIPTLLLIHFVQRPDTSFGVMLAVAATAGLGGGNFASSMANISFFYPDREKGYALGLNAAGGNIGVASVQLVVPLAIAVGGGAAIHLSYAGFIWLPLIALAAFGAWRFMDNLSTARSNFTDQLVVMRNEHTRIISVLYIGTFGSFVGYSGAFPLLMKLLFPELTVSLAFLGPLVGSLARPIGGKLADRLGGAKVTLWNFAAMAVASAGVLAFADAKNLGGFLACFLALFVTTGIGNGSTFRMMPAIFRARRLEGVDKGNEANVADALAAARRDGAAAIGIASAIGAIGGFLIPRGLGASIHATGSPVSAFAVFLLCYAACFAITWWCYLRSSFLMRRLPSLAHARA